MAMGGGNVVSSETLFPSPIQNPNFNFMPAHHQLPFQPLSSILSPPKRYHCHTAQQIQEMENLFKECPHPDDKQRMKLSQDLGLKPRQVKFWFQNRRTQMKAQQDRSDNVMLRAENENLKNENYRLQAALCNIMCPDCGGPAMIGDFWGDIGIDEQHLRLENARLKE
ncbi:homeobox-leucine zipper protein ROC3-like [Malus sylvestris]|uniref:homeobox-leucine zipper protein ROC3-like n=1 Tax=Malus sylvestris TaxID=3752 RepID=UPI0021AC2F7A|nr:homeobox-leucine zipper protein ROC3-like [Malus sylvestris]